MFLIVGALAGFALLAALIIFLTIAVVFSQNAKVPKARPVVNATPDPTVTQEPDPVPAAAPKTVGLRPSTPSVKQPALSPSKSSEPVAPLVSRGLAVSATDDIDDVNPDQIERAKARTAETIKKPITFEFE